MGKGSIIYQVASRFEAMKGFGESKLAARKQVAAELGQPLTREIQSGKIHSTITWKTYRRWALSMATWLREKLGIRRLDQVTPEVAALYIRHLMNERNYSAYSLHTVRSAIAKTLGVRGPDIMSLPARRLSDIKRSRHQVKMDKDFSPQGKYRLVVIFAEATGFRASELRRIRVKDITVNDDGTVVIHLDKGKNGQPRDMRVLRGYESSVLAIRDTALRCGGGPETELFGWVPKKIKFDEHAVRAQYAWRLYKEIEDLNRPREYLLRRRNGEIFDKIALMKVSESVGHHRIDVMVKHYLWNRA